VFGRRFRVGDRAQLAYISSMRLSVGPDPSVVPEPTLVNACVCITSSSPWLACFVFAKLHFELSKSLC